ncbi:heavy metal translocating P-type ATPase [Wenzhouxiangella marina]|uniref:heavy metal translocating P-type ATPase n=1 Tax=Wenzhouxiangella marina TaxID=1579979 RepID=UPI0006733618|nr:heavy metal translocating P-type ATPase [Wenzhouxiangella marina]
MSTAAAAARAASPDACWHCGEPIPPGVDLHAEVQGEDRPMCCHGCQTVAQLIDRAGLDRYYDFRDALPERPEREPVGAETFLAWDRDAVYDHHAMRDCNGHYQLPLVLENVHCAACAWLIRRFVGSLPGVIDLQVDIADGRAQLLLDKDRTPLSEVAGRLASLGYRPHLDSPDASLDRDREQRREMLKALVVAGLGMMQVMSYALAGYIGAFQDIDPTSERFFQLISMVVAVPVALYSGRIFYRAAWRTLASGRMGMDVPVALAMLLALGSSIVITWLDAGETYFDSVVMFIFFLLLGRYAVLVARQKAGRLHSALARALPTQVRRLTPDGAELVSLVELASGDRVQITSGETVAADGRVLRGEAQVDEALLSGESIPRRRVPGDTVLAGSLVRDGQIEITVEQLGQGTALAGIVRLLDQARQFRPRLAQLADRIAGAFVAFVLTAAAISAIAWTFVDPAHALPVALAVLVVSCPCALALGTPVALASATRGMARLGVLIHRPDALEALPKISHLVFDKTGTLTRSDPELVETRLEAGLDADQARRLAGRLERVSRHPLASAFAPFDDGAPVEQAQAVASQGVQGRIDGVEYRLGRPAFVGEALEARPVEPGPGQWLALADGQQLLAWFRVELRLRDGAEDLIEQLHRDGKTLVLASGDRAANVQALAERLGIEHWHAEQSPADKLALVRSLQAEGHRVAMIGDGINDAPVLAGADVSMALAEGADIARTQADLVITGQGLQRLAAALALAPKVRRIIAENLAWALLYNLTALPFAAFGLIPPWAAAIGMSASSLLVVLNARRLGRS